jgi:predicted nucleic acid-binding protein
VEKFKMQKLYIDTNIFIDALRDRGSSYGRDSGTQAMSIFSQARHGRYELVISEWTLEELYKHVDEEKVEELLEGIDDIEFCEYTEEQKKQAIENSDHWQDFLHGLIAEEQNVDCIVTQNIKDFKILSGVKAKLPSQVR